MTTPSKFTFEEWWRKFFNENPPNIEDRDDRYREIRKIFEDGYSKGWEQCDRAHFADTTYDD
tara:strand:- start:2239 stop:2424 length:186 start_codon:yes stop_codon:yes gene_type:complete